MTEYEVTFIVCGGIIFAVVLILLARSKGPPDDPWRMIQ